MGLTQYAPAPESGDLSSHPKLSGLAVIAHVHLFTKFEVPRPFRSEDMADFWSQPLPSSCDKCGKILTFD